MKKRAVLYTIYCCIVIIVLASFLVFKLNKNDDVELASRAKSITLNTPRELTITTNKKIKLLDGFISIEPANAIDLLTYSITASATTSTDYFDFDFKNKTFSARKTGYYYIKFEVPKNAYSNLNDTLKIHAVADSKQDFTLKTNQILVGKTARFEDIFNQNSVFKYTVELENDNLSYSDNCFYANKEGVTKVSITINRNDYVSYVNEYEIYVEKDVSAPQNPEDDDNPSEKDKNPDEELNPDEGKGGGQEDNKQEDQSGGEQSGEDNENQGNTGGEGSESSGSQTGGAENEGGDSGDAEKDKDENNKDDDIEDSGKDDNTGNQEQKPQEKYEIHVKEMDFNEFTSYYTVEFEVMLGKTEYVNQNIMANVSDNTIAQISSYNPPFVRLKILKSGTFTLTLTLEDNPEISISVEISVVLENEKT